MNPERQRILTLYEGLRVTDVSDGMDRIGRQDLGSMDPSIRPLWRDPQTMAHAIVGFAYTARFVNTNRPVTARGEEEMREMIRWWYKELAHGPDDDDIQEGDVVVIDGADTHVGYLGSSNTLGWMLAGAVGFVTNGGCRDTDEVILEKVPVYSAGIEKSIRPARMEVLDFQVPINCGGVLVRPGDVVVADGDGVIVVPIEVAEEVAMHARKVANSDRRVRRERYLRRGLPLDHSVEPLLDTPS